MSAIGTILKFEWCSYWHCQHKREGSLKHLHAMYVGPSAMGMPSLCTFSSYSGSMMSKHKMSSCCKLSHGMFINIGHLYLQNWISLYFSFIHVFVDWESANMMPWDPKWLFSRWRLLLTCKCLVVNNKLLGNDFWVPSFCSTIKRMGEWRRRLLFLLGSCPLVAQFSRTQMDDDQAYDA